MAKSPIDKPGVKHCHPGVTAIVHGTGKVALELKFWERDGCTYRSQFGGSNISENITI